ncbi:MAG: hypothetical protein EOO85_26015 [Pedobacter sp.]|nr:MAG: hypothetical protein EOO85_26015 [Pedobacter sp.]
MNSILKFFKALLNGFAINNNQRSTFKEYFATPLEIIEVQTQINKKGYWECYDEWRISTTTVSRIELKNVNGEDWYITTVKCVQETMIPSRTIEKAIIFKKAYFDFQIDLFYNLGWSSSV